MNRREFVTAWGAALSASASPLVSELTGGMAQAREAALALLKPTRGELEPAWNFMPPPS